MAINIEKPKPPDHRKEVGDYTDSTIYKVIVIVIFFDFFVAFWAYDYNCHEEYRIKQVTCDGETVYWVEAKGYWTNIWYDQGNHGHETIEQARIHRLDLIARNKNYYNSKTVE